MPILNPPYLGLVLRKNDRTKGFIEKEIEFINRMAKGKPVELNEDEYLIGFSVAMNGADLSKDIEALEKQGAEKGKDFIPTASPNGLIDPAPEWLSVKEVEVEGITCQQYTFVG